MTTLSAALSCARSVSKIPKRLEKHAGHDVIISEAAAWWPLQCYSRTRASDCPVIIIAKLPAESCWHLEEASGGQSYIARPLSVHESAPKDEVIGSERLAEQAGSFFLWRIWNDVAKSTQTPSAAFVVHAYS